MTWFLTRDSAVAEGDSLKTSPLKRLKQSPFAAAKHRIGRQRGSDTSSNAPKIDQNVRAVRVGPLFIRVSKLKT